jgi:hypothetical protein
MLISSIIVLFAANLLGLNAQTATVDNTTTPLQQQPLDKPGNIYIIDAYQSRNTHTLL